MNKSQKRYFLLILVSSKDSLDLWFEIAVTWAVSSFSVFSYFEETKLFLQFTPKKSFLFIL